jgi:hypothetical protein
MDRVGRGTGARGGATVCRDAQENLRDPDAHAEAAQEKDFHSDEKEIAHADPGKKIFAKPDPYAFTFTAPEEKTFAHTKIERNAGEIDNANAFAAIEEKTLTNTHAERNTDSNSNSNAFAHTGRDPHARSFALAITEKAWRAQREPDPGPDQRLRQLSGQRAEASRLRARADHAQSRLQIRLG